MSENTIYQCRLCLKDSEYCYSLIEEGVTDIIESFSNIKIAESDGIPAICCAECLEDVYMVCNIRSRIIESDKILCERREDLRKEVTEDEFKAEAVDDTDSTTSDNKDFVVIKGEEDGESDAASPEKITLISVNDDPGDSDETPDSEPSVECLECNLKFPYRKLYLQHMKKHSIVSVCEICDRQVLSCNYRRHLEVHKSSPKICEICGAVAKNAESLRGHMFYMHKSTAEQYQCPNCHKFFRYKYKFTLHMRKAHGGDKTHTCEVCGKAFFTARDVNRHIRMTHMKLRPYACQYCSKGFSSSYARRTHERQHTNEKPFKCEICSEGFRQRVSLKTHLKSKHGVEFSGDQGVHKIETEDIKDEVM